MTRQVLYRATSLLGGSFCEEKGIFIDREGFEKDIAKKGEYLRTRTLSLPALTDSPSIAGDAKEFFDDFDDFDPCQPSEADLLVSYLSPSDAHCSLASIASFIHLPQIYIAHVTRTLRA
jgi:hypothetical protein